MKHEIEIPDLPEGWEPVAYRYAYGNEYVLSDGDIEQIRQSIEKTSTKRLIVRKKQPRRIVLEETEVCEYPTKGDWYFYRGELRKWNQYNTCDHQHKLWKIVEDNK